MDARNRRKKHGRGAPMRLNPGDERLKVAGRQERLGGGGVEK